MSTRRLLLPASLLVTLALACGEEGNSDDGGEGAASGNGAGGSGGTTGGTGGGSAAQGGSGASGQGGSSGSGTSSGGGGTSAGSAGTAGAGGSLAPEELRDATYEECIPGCNLVHSACPEVAFQDCLGGCQSVADNRLAVGSCGLEFYKVWVCVNDELTPADVTCSGPAFNGCTEEQAAYNECM